MNNICPRCQSPTIPYARRCAACGASLNPTRADTNIGRTVGNLKLVSRLGMGGMGAVYRAEHQALGTPYAIKVLHAQFSNDETLAERFRREAIACSRLRHENTVFVTDFGVDPALGIYIVMEFLEGATLKQLLRAQGRFSVGRFGRVGAQICDAMAAAHRLDIVHRDLKPDNVMVLGDPSRRDFVKVLDFGIAQLRNADEEPEGEQLTRVGTVVGTPAYISPEQVDKRIAPVGPGADIYAVGIMFYEMLAGRPPFQNESEIMLLSQHIMAPPDPISTYRPEFANTRLEGLLTMMLAKKPSLRPSSMEEVRAMLGSAIDELIEMGVADAVYESGPQEAPAISTGTNYAQRSNPSLRITNVLQRIRADSPNSPAAALLSALPTVNALKGEALSLAIWGVLQQELLDAEPDDPRFAQSAAHVTLLLQAVMDSTPGATAPTPSQEKVFRSLKNLLALSDPQRQQRLVEVLAPLSGHPLFPHDVMPKGSATKSGAWSAFKNVMTREIKLGGDRPSTPNPATSASQPPAPPRASQPPAQPVSADDKGLIDKLKKPVSVESLKSVFTHEINLFGSKKSDKT